MLNNLLSKGWEFKLYTGYLEKPGSGYYTKEIPLDMYKENNILLRYYPESTVMDYSTGEERLEDGVLTISNLFYVHSPLLIFKTIDILNLCLKEALRRQSLPLRDRLLVYIQPCFFEHNKEIGFITEDEYVSTPDGLQHKPEYDYDNCHRLQNLTFENLFKIVDTIAEDFPGLLKFEISKIDRGVFSKASDRLETKILNIFRGT